MNKAKGPLQMQAPPFLVPSSPGPLTLALRSADNLDWHGSQSEEKLGGRRLPGSVQQTLLQGEAQREQPRDKTPDSQRLWQPPSTLRLTLSAVSVKRLPFSG